MNPASTMKLVTTYSALHLLGPAFTFRTEVLSEAPLIGEVAARRPVRARRRRSQAGHRGPVAAREPAARLRHPRDARRRGARQDACSSRCATTRRSSTARKAARTTSGPIALLVNFKSIAITLVPDPVAKVARVIVVPEVAGLQGAAHRAGRSRAAAATGAAGCSADISDPMNIRMRGVYPLACGERAIYLGALEHTNYFARGVPRVVGAAGRRAGPARCARARCRPTRG